MTESIDYKDTLNLASYLPIVS